MREEEGWEGGGGERGDGGEDGGGWDGNEDRVAGGDGREYEYGDGVKVKMKIGIRSLGEGMG